MSKFKCAGVDQAKVNAELRELHGETCTRQDLLSYRERTGVDPKWIRRNPEARTGRGLYKIPGTDAAPAAAFVGTRKLAKAERAVLPTPFDDGTYDGDDAPTPAAKKSKKIRKGDPDDPQAITNQLDYDPTIGERAAPVFVHAWICDNKECVGRKPGSYYAMVNGTEAPPTCECGSSMSRHTWTKKVK